MEITAIKEQLSITAVLSHYHLKPDRHARLNCPFHEDKTPSLQVYYKTQTCYCFSANCPTHGKSMDVIDFIMNMDQSTKHEAIKKAESLIIGTTESQPPQSRTALLTQLFTYFRNGAHGSKPARAYLASRNLEPLLSIYSHGVGYNSGQFHHGSRRTEQLIKDSLEYGLLLDKGHVNKTGEKAYSPFGKNCIVFALRNPQHQVVSFYFRSILDKPNSKHFYLKDRQGLYPCYPKKETKKLILTESIIDAATLLQLDNITQEYGILALYGTNGLTKEHAEAIQTWATNPEPVEGKEVIFFLDGDAAGRKAVEKYTKELQHLNIKITAVDTPGGEDINSLSVSHPEEQIKLFAHLLKQRKAINEPAALLSSSTGQQTAPKPTQPAAPKQEESTAGILDTTNPEQITFTNKRLTCHVWGGIEKDNLSRLKISLHVKSKENKYKTFRDDVNLYSHQSVKKLITNLTEALEESTTVVSQAIAELTEQLEEYRLKEREQQVKALRPKAYEMTGKEQQAAETFLTTPELVKNTLTLISQSGLIGEQKNGLLLFFLYLSRFFDEPLHAIIFGRSGSGKTYLQTKVSECLPEESVRTITSLTENTLYYSSKDFWKHKVLLIEDLDGAYNAFLPLREFMSKQSITKLTTDKDAKGNNVQKVLTVEGPICVSGATTKESIYEDNANRSYLLHINEGASHLEEVMDYQRKLQAGLVDKHTQDIAKQLLKNTQRLLKPIKVINPYATQLKIPDSVFKKLRTNMHYLRLIEIITFYHQKQRKLKTDSAGTPYIETTLDDISWANRLVKESLLRKSDELSGELREFFEMLKRWYPKDQDGRNVTFFAKEVRKALRVHPMKIARYLTQLQNRGYIKRTGGHRNTGYEYEITDWDDYSQLQDEINVLDQVLDQIRNRKLKKVS